MMVIQYPKDIKFEEEVTPYSLVPFGGGVRICPGWILLFAHHFAEAFARYMELDQGEGMIADPAPAFPANGFPIKLIPRL
ncbi:hypothetical protein SUGI_0889030 [Cryptomeria japonica]|nr:hypothetical protein SUGI_0889030 [Cryptomeria japonica]